MVELAERLAALSRQQRARLAERVGAADVATTRLIAYVKAAPGAVVEPADVVAHVADHLPSYMVPAEVILLDEMPRTVTGKIDRRALVASSPEPSVDGDVDWVEARNDSEKALAAIWADVLGVDDVSVHDNFFELGGDSILSIQVVSRARQSGLQMSTRLLVEFPTIAQLAVRATSVDDASASSSIRANEATEPFDLAPIQSWFFEQNLVDAAHWNQWMVLDCRVPLRQADLQAAVDAVVAAHPALRLRFVQGPSGWMQRFQPDATVIVEHVDLAQSAHIEEELARQVELRQKKLDLVAGPLVSIAAFELGAGRRARLAIIVHHLAIDTLSWATIISDLQRAYEAVRRGEPVVWPQATRSYDDWIAHARQRSPSIDDWEMLAAREVASLPVDHRTGVNDVASRDTVTLALGADETHALMHDVPAAYNTRVDDILLTALASALSRWTGRTEHLIGLEGHGRDDSVARTVGWFTSFFPVVVHCDPEADAGESIKSVKEQLRLVTPRGADFGLARYGRPPSEPLGGIDPEVLFNFAGRFDQLLAESSMFSVSSSLSVSHAPTQRRALVLEINTMVVQDKLTSHFTYSRALHSTNTVQTLARSFVEAVEALVGHCTSAGAGGYTPSDFPDVELSQAQLDALLGRL